MNQKTFLVQRTFPVVNISVSYWRRFLFDQMDMQLLKRTSGFALCLIRSAPQLARKMQGFPWGSLRVSPSQPTAGGAGWLLPSTRHVAFACRFKSSLIWVFTYLLSFGCEGRMLLTSTLHFCPQMSVLLRPSKGSVLEAAICLLFNLTFE